MYATTPMLVLQILAVAEHVSSAPSIAAARISARCTAATLIQDAPHRTKIAMTLMPAPKILATLRLAAFILQSIVTTPMPAPRIPAIPRQAAAMLQFPAMMMMPAQWTLVTQVLAASIPLWNARELFAQ